MVISPEQALAILQRDLARCEPPVTAALGAAAQTAFDGAVSFEFNTGAIRKASWVGAFRAGRRDEARVQLVQWTRAGGRSVAGLRRRREAEARLIFDGDYGEAAESKLVARSPAEMKSIQRDLTALDFYSGPVDGLDSDALRQAITAYQKSHPDLVADGIAGPATLASIARDRAARRATGASAGSVATAVVASAGFAAHAHAHHPWLVAAGIAAVVAVAAIMLLARRWGGEIKRAITPTKKDV